MCIPAELMHAALLLIHKEGVPASRYMIDGNYPVLLVLGWGCVEMIWFLSHLLAGGWPAHFEENKGAKRKHKQFAISIRHNAW